MNTNWIIIALIFAIITVIIIGFSAYNPEPVAGDDTEDYIFRACLLGDHNSCLDHNAQEWIRWCTPDYIDEVYCMTGTHDPDWYDDGDDP